MATGYQAGDHAARLRAFGLDEEDVAAWQDSGLPGEALDGWLTDRVARRPSGSRAWRVYGAEDVHDFARRAILAALDLHPGDRLLEIGCGGGLLLRDATSTGAQAAGLDHSDDMVRLARHTAPGADVVLAAAEDLPFADGVITSAAMSVVFLFLDDPVVVLRECRRVLGVWPSLPAGRNCVELRRRRSRSRVWATSTPITNSGRLPSARACAMSRYTTTTVGSCSRHARRDGPNRKTADGELARPNSDGPREAYIGGGAACVVPARQLDAQLETSRNPRSGLVRSG